MNLTITASILAFLVIVFALSLYMDGRPTELGQVRLIPFKGVMLFSLILIVVLAAHMLSFLKR